jgi:voltage-gated potassium channel
MKKTIAIYGFTTLGSKIAVAVSEKYKILVVSYDDDEINEAQELGYETYKSTLLNDDELINIGISKNVDSLFCVSKSNKNNLFITLSARNLDKNLKIITTSKTKAEAKKLIIAGATKVLNPNELGALRIYRYMTKPLLLKVLDEILFSKSDLNISELYISKKSKLNGVFFKDITIHKQYNILLIGIMDKELGDKFIFNTKGINHKVDEGDILVVVGKNSDLEKFYRHVG